MKRIVLGGGLALALAMGWAVAEAPAPPAAAGRNLAALERDWALVSFELQLSGAPFDTLRARYQEAWIERAAALERMQVGVLDRQGMLQEMDRIQARLDQECRLLLSAEQRDRLHQLREARRAGWDGFRAVTR